MDRRCRRVSSEREREQEQHFQTQRKIAEHVRRQAVEAMFAEESIDQSEVIGLPVGTGFGREAVREIEQSVESEGGGEEERPE